MNDQQTQSAYTAQEISQNVICVTENDPWNRHPLIYLVSGPRVTLIIDTGCGSGDLKQFLCTNVRHFSQSKWILVNTHNHAEQTGCNWQFSASGVHGIHPNLLWLGAGSNDPYYTRLKNSTFDWNVKSYKVTKWLCHNEVFSLNGDCIEESRQRGTGRGGSLRQSSDDLSWHLEKNECSSLRVRFAAAAQNVSHKMNESWTVRVLHTPGHSPDSICLWYGAGERLFVGDLFYQSQEILCTYEHSDLVAMERSARYLISFIKSLPRPLSARLSCAKVSSDISWYPYLENYRRLILAIFAGRHIGRPLRVDRHEGSLFESRDRVIRLVVSRHILEHIEQCRRK